MSKPIQNRFLIHSVEINGKTFNKVRIEPYKQAVKGVGGMEYKQNSILFADIVNTPSYHELKGLLKVGAKLKVFGIVREVSSVEILVAEKEHHLEGVIE